MQSDLKTRIMMAGAMFLTFMLVLTTMEQQQRKSQPPSGPAEPAAHGTNLTVSTAPTAPSPAAAGAPAEAAPAPVESENPLVSGQIQVETAGFVAVFTTRGAALRSYRLKKYYLTAEKKPGEEVALLDELAAGQASLALSKLGDGRTERAIRDYNYQLLSFPRGLASGTPTGSVANDAGELTFRAVLDQWEITKRYIFTPDREFGFALVLELRNLAAEARQPAYTLIGPAGLVPDDKSTYGMIEVSSAAGPGANVSVNREKLHDLVKSGAPFVDSRKDASWLALRNRFFAVALLRGGEQPPFDIRFSPLVVDPAYVESHPEHKTAFAAHFTQDGRVYNAEGQLATLPATERLAGGGSATARHEFVFYGGPMADDILGRADPRLPVLVTYTLSWFDPISRLLLHLLDWMAGIFGNCGVAIVLLTILVKAVVHPLTRKATTSMHKMQKVGPQMKELQAKFKNNPQKLQQEMMRLYREEGASPLGGCLPMFIQLPIFFALYGAFSAGFAGRQARFIPGWIDDLSQPDTIWNWGYHLPLVGDGLNILPIIYMILSLVQMSMQPASEDPQVAQQQKMMRFMPVVFFFLFYSMPSGLVLYFTVNSIVTVLEHWHIKRHLGPLPTAAAAPAPAGTGFAKGHKGGKKK